MRKYAVLFLAVLAVIFNTKAFAAEPADLTVGAGYRVDALDWNIAGNSSGQDPNILSELTWENLEIAFLKAKLRAPVTEKIFLRAYADYGWIFHGDNQDSDYNTDDRTNEFSRTNNKADDGWVTDASAGLGYKFVFGELDIAPLAGLSYHGQYLKIQDGVQVIPATGPFAGLDSSYDANWFGPWVGVDLAYALGNFSLFGSAEYHYAYYWAEANWNLRSDFAHPKSFEHDADGYGVIASLGADYVISDRWSVNATFDYQLFKATHGTDTTFFADGTASETRLNEVNWDSLAVMLGVKYEFF